MLRETLVIPYNSSCPIFTHLSLRCQAFWPFLHPQLPIIYPPTQKATPACRNAFLPEGRHFGVQARSLRPWLNALRVPYEAHRSVVGFASEASALRSMWRRPPHAFLENPQYNTLYISANPSSELSNGRSAVYSILFEIYMSKTRTTSLSSLIIG